MQENKESGSFITGFGMGLMAGAAAYFLFGTEQGKELRKKALNEWEDAQSHISDKSGVEVPKKLKQILQEVVNYFGTTLKEMQDIHESVESYKKNLPARSKKAESKPKSNSRFKGL